MNDNYVKFLWIDKTIDNFALLLYLKAKYIFN